MNILFKTFSLMLIALNVDATYPCDLHICKLKSDEMTIPAIYAFTSITDF